MHGQTKIKKKKGMVFGFRKTATALIGPEIEEDVLLIHPAPD
jgi:hypothetical protein